MRRIILICFTVCTLMGLLFYTFLSAISDYDVYRKWLDREILDEMDSLLGDMNEKIKNKSITIKDCEEIASEYDNLYDEAVAKNVSQDAHKHLIHYLELRHRYHVEYIIYLKEGKEQIIKAQLKNVYDDGNIEYQLFLDDLEKFAHDYHEVFVYPYGLY